MHANYVLFVTSHPTYSGSYSRRESQVEVFRTVVNVKVWELQKAGHDLARPRSVGTSAGARRAHRTSAGAPVCSYTYLEAQGLSMYGTSGTGQLL